MNEKDVQSQKLRTREGFGTRTPDAMIKFPRVAIGGGTSLPKAPRECKSFVLSTFVRHTKAQT